MIRDLWKLLAPFHRTFGWFVILVAVYEGVQIAEGYTISLVVRLFGAGTEMLVWVAAVAGLVIFDELFMRLDNYVDWHIVTKHSHPIYKHLKTRAIAKFLEMDIPWHQRHNSGSLVAKVSNGVWKVIELTDTLSWEFVPTLIQTFLSLIPIIILSPQTALLTLPAFLLFVWLTLKAHVERKSLREKKHDLYETEWHEALEIVRSVETIFMFGQKERLLAQQEELHGKILSLGNRESEIGIFKYNRIRIRILNFARRGILIVWVWQLYSGTLDIAGLIFLSVLTEKLFHGFWRFARLVDRASEASEGVARLTHLMSEESSIRTEGQMPEVKGSVGVALKNVCFAYEGEYDAQNGALHELDMTIQPGKTTAIVGPSGAGKTTFRKIAPGLYPIQEGSIQIGGVDAQQMSEEDQRRFFSYVPQGDEVFIYSGTVRYNIAFSNPEATDSQLRQAATLAGIHEFIESLPEGYETQVGERGKRLSGGQKQRVAIARAILAQKPILIFDEATSSVDAITEREIQTKMKEIAEGKTVVIIAHRLSTVKNADNIIVMDGGRKVEEGTHEELIRLGGLYAKMVALQTEERVLA